MQIDMQMRQRPKSGRQGSYLSLDSQHLGSHLRVHSRHHLSNVSISIIFSSRSTLQQGEFLSHSVRSRHHISISAASPVQQHRHQHHPQISTPPSSLDQHLSLRFISTATSSHHQGETSAGFQQNPQLVITFT